MERIIRLIAGSFILLSLLLSRLHSPYWLFFTAFVGLNLVQSSFTRWCLMEDILRYFKIGEEQCGCGCAADPASADSAERDRGTAAAGK